MKMSMGMGMSHRQELRQDQHLTLEQRKAEDLQLRLEISHQLNGGDEGEHFRPAAFCQQCHQGLTAEEILKGFTNNPQDTTTECPSCHERFQPNLVNRSRNGSVSVRFYCRDQALYALKSCKRLTPDKIRKQDLGLFQSAISHFGSLTNAFAHIGVEYTLVTIPGWKDKVVPFLGQAPDTMIAQIAGVSKATIGRWRRAQGIRRYYRSEY